jgi:PKD repeat protein
VYYPHGAGGGGGGGAGVIIITYTIPAVTFSGAPLSGIFPTDVAFSSDVTNNPISFAWTFGDGGTSSAQNPSHTYNIPGKFTVVLTVTNAYCTVSLTKTDYISMYWEPTSHSYIITADPYRGA